MTIRHNLSLIQTRIHEYETRYERKPNSIQLLAVTKKQSINSIQQAIDTGQLAFGENYLQEALPKINHFANTPTTIEWHFIGPIQSNKTKKIAENFSWVHSVDSIKIAKRLNDQRPSHLPPLNICLEINVSQEPSKAGLSPKDVYDIAKYCMTLPNVKLRGLMAIPAIKLTLKEQRHELHKLKIIYTDLVTNNVPIDTLSMGMSDDLEAAIAEGATIVRIGTAIFGKRIVTK